MDWKWCLVSIWYVVLLICFGPVSAQEKPEVSAEQVLTERAHQYWEAIKLNDLSTAYRLESGSLNGALTASAFRQGLARAAPLIDYQINGVRIDGSGAQVDIRVRYKLPQLRDPVTWNRSNPWVLIDGQWYHQTPAATSTAPAPN